MSHSLRPHELQHARPPCPSPTSGVHPTMSIVSVMPSNHLILCHPLLLLPSIFPSIRVFSNESALCIRWPKFWSFSSNISPSNEHPGLIFFKMDWLDLLESKGLSRVFSNTTVQKHQFFSSILQLNTTLFSIYLTASKLEQKLSNQESYLTTMFQFFTKPGRIFGAMNNWSFLELGLSK